MSFPRFDSDFFIVVKTSSHQTSAKPRSSKCHHFCFPFASHNYCPICREFGKGDDPCVTNQSPCNICASFSEEQQIKIKHRRWYIRKQKTSDPNTSKDDLDLQGDDDDAFSGSQTDLEKDELPNDTAMVLTKPQTRPNPNVHFSWSLAGVLWPPELAFSPTW